MSQLQLPVTSQSVSHSQSQLVIVKVAVAFRLHLCSRPITLRYTAFLIRTLHFQSILSLISTIKSVMFILGRSHRFTNYWTEYVAPHSLIWLQIHLIDCSSCLHVSNSLFWPYVLRRLCRIKSESFIIEATTFALFGSFYLYLAVLHCRHASTSLWHLILCIYVIPAIISFYFLCFFIVSFVSDP